MCDCLRAHARALSFGSLSFSQDGSRGVVVRPYTPSHTTIGYLELVIKRYEEGKMSKHIHSLKPSQAFLKE